MKKKSTIKLVGGICIFLIIIVLLVCGSGFYFIHSPAFAVKKNVYVYVDNRKDYQALLSQLESTAQLKNTSLFTQVADALKYPGNMKPGRYEITPRTNYLEAVRMLRGGFQSPIKLTFNSIRLKKDFADRIGEQLIFDSGDLLARLNDPDVAAAYGLDTTTILTLFIPNTYEMYWTTSVDKFLERMQKEHDRFWTKERLAKAEAIHLSPEEVSILASIVEEETAARQEYPLVAGLYLNRLRKGMPLQADPTVKFAVGDFALRRILNTHLQVESPYNTYRHQGLPPGPIRIPSINGIDGVLNYREHPFLYMCAKEDFSGTHNFAATLSEHNLNAQKYHEALNRKMKKR